MIVVKLTVLLTVVCVVMFIAFRIWCKCNPLKALISDYPVWTYIMVLLGLLDIIAIGLSMFWFLLFY